jgi:hypothetical protein
VHSAPRTWKPQTTVPAKLTARFINKQNPAASSCSLRRFYINSVA